MLWDAGGLKKAAVSLLPETYISSVEKAENKKIPAQKNFFEIFVTLDNSAAIVVYERSILKQHHNSNDARRNKNDKQGTGRYDADITCRLP